MVDKALDDPNASGKDFINNFGNIFFPLKKINKQKIEGLKNFLIIDYNNCCTNKFFKLLFKYYDIINSEELKSKIDSYDATGFYKLIMIVGRDLPKFVLDAILKKKCYDVFQVVNLPDKYQMRLVKMNPYFIQYISNPSQQVLDYVEKTDKDALQYKIGNEI